MKKLFIIPVLAFAAFGATSAAHAQMTAAPEPVPPGSCITITHNLSYGATDASSGGDVTSLQRFLNQKGYLTASPVGVYGPLTYAAVVKFQSAEGLPAFGYVGPMTRPIIHTRSCGTVSGTVSVSSIDPSVGPIGTKVTVHGSGFTKTNNTVMLSGGAISGIESDDGATLAFTVPDAMGAYCAPGMACILLARLVTPGNYDLSIKNANGDSNAVNFTVTGEGNDNSPSISSIDAPARLSISQTGEWTVHATIPNSSTGEQLHYAAVWGDEPMDATVAGIRAPDGPITAETSATFSHAYRASGTYTPSFTVSDDSGNSTATSVTVTVDPIY